MPPTEELTQALQEQRMAGLEKNSVELIAKTLKVSEDTVLRVVFAYLELEDVAAYTPLQNVALSDAELSVELKNAIRYAMQKGGQRLMLRYAIEHGSTLAIDAEHLVPASNPIAVCNGCPERLPCLADSLHTAEKCLSGRKSRLPVRPLRVIGTNVEVEAIQPAGLHLIPIAAILRRSTDVQPGF